MMIQRIFSCAIFGLLPYFLVAQVLPYQKYTSRNGLIADRITTIQQDNSGFIWMGSYFGVCRYDGLTFEKINLPLQQQNKFVSAILPVGDKVYITFSLKGGLAEFANGKVTPYYLTDEKAGDFVCLYDDGENGLLLVTSNNLTYQFKNGVFTLLFSFVELTHARTNAILKDDEGSIWLATESNLIIKPRDPKLPLRVFDADKNHFVLQKTSDGNIWVASFDGKFGNIKKMKSYKGSGETVIMNEVTLPWTRPVLFTGNTNDALWFISFQKGLCKVSSNGETNFYQCAVDFDADINFIFSDREQNVWVANDPGVIKVSNFSAYSYYFKELAPAGGSIFINRDNQWVSNAKFLYQVNDSGMSKVTDFRDKTDIGYIGSLDQDIEGNLWLLRWDEGLWKTTWEKGKCIWKKYFIKYEGRKVSATASVADNKGNRWVGGLSGIYRIVDNNIADHFHPPIPDSGPMFITAMTIDTMSHDLWLGENQNGIFRIHYEQQRDGKFLYSLMDHISAAQGLKDTYIRSILLDSKNNLWVGSRVGGIYKIKKNQGGYVISEFNSRTGVDCSRVPAIIEEKDKAIWFGTNNGVYRYGLADSNWEHFSVSDGLLAAEVFSIAFDPAKQELWALTVEGVTRLNTTRTPEKKIAPLVNLTAIHVLGKTDTTALYNSEEKIYSSRESSIGFVFAGLTFIDERKILYKYRLDGYDKDWSTPVSSNNVNYASLPPGGYTFKVLASNAQGVWSEQHAVFSFRITSPFYKSTWFIVAVIFGAAALFYFIRIDRLKQKYKIEKVRLGIARDLHDDIGSALGSINLLSKSAHRKLENNKEITEIAGAFVKIGDSAQSTLESMDDIIWSINPEKDKVEDLILRMREFAIPLLEAKQIQFSFDLISSDYGTIPMDTRRNIFLIFKESIHNILKHAECTFVKIRTGIHNNVFILEISDDGLGFDASLESNRNGLKNLYHRAELSQGILNVNSLSGKGTTIFFSVKIR
ncbi:MAG TPA: two-component regulator propeller domain-containing protein [Flavitalea sp.]|nr:two-component regulator propeller domain-containing protein [Flavitalea sp.]